MSKQKDFLIDYTSKSNALLITVINPDKNYNAASLEEAIRATFGKASRQLVLKQDQFAKRELPGFNSECICIGKDSIRNGDWDKITKKAEELVKQRKIKDLGV